MKLPIFLLIVTFFSCDARKVKVVSATFSDGAARTVYYFQSRQDAEQNVIVNFKDGVGHADKPLAFEEQEFYHNGQLKYKGHYFNGQAFGLWQYFYDDGKPEAKCYYLNGISRDTVYCWYPSGKIKRQLVEIDTVKAYWHGIDYFENGQKSNEAFLLRDSIGNWVVDGSYKEWYVNGKPKLEALLRNNKTVGKWRSWNEQGDTEEGEKPFPITF